MSSQNINVLLTSFPGLGLPSTLCLQIDRSSTMTSLRQQIFARMPLLYTRLIVTTTSSKEISPSESHISSLLSSEFDAFLPLRLSLPLRGGKGGFGSQLRAAGGRMSSRRKNNQGDNSNSNRNLDGRRLRTVNEAKALAEYLALKPDLEKKEQEVRRKRWEEIVTLAEKKEEEIRNGTKAKAEGKWIVDKEEAGERAREAVLIAMKSGEYHDNLGCSSGKNIGQLARAKKVGEDWESMLSMQAKDFAATALPDSSAKSIQYAGFDEDDEFMSDEETVVKDEDFSGAGKGKSRVINGQILKTPV